MKKLREELINDMMELFNKTYQEANSLVSYLVQFDYVELIEEVKEEDDLPYIVDVIQDDENEYREVGA